MKQTHVTLTKKAIKDIDSLPRHIERKFFHWVDLVHADGLEAVRKISGFHDEPLTGKRKGQRSIRLNDGYRAFYTIEKGEIQIVEVFAVNNHKY